VQVDADESFAGSALHRSHWNLYLPSACVQTPLVVVSAPPTTAGPETEGFSVFSGPAAVRAATWEAATSVIVTTASTTSVRLVTGFSLGSVFSPVSTTVVSFPLARLTRVTSYSLRRLRLRPGEEHREVVETPVEPLRLGGLTYVAVPATVPADLVVQRATSGDVFGLRFAVSVEGPCMRCLADAVAHVRVDAREYQDSRPDAPVELVTDYVADGELLIGDWVRDQVALSLPAQLLCRPDCAGLCAVCGKDLNVEPHEHADDDLDPRWAALDALRGDTPEPAA
jgi:DUF177 domain-containing protein